jgi:pyruvate/2-oxoglutarate dehydrogenase complex dihydrolipoamide dehydrogenase (E3) component
VNCQPVEKGYGAEANKMSKPKQRMNAETSSDASAEVDVIVLGVGTSGEDLSLRLLAAGLDVVGIEAALVGGECPYWACLPSKMMIRAANVLQEARRVGVFAGRAEIIPDWGPVAARVRAEATGGWDDSVAVSRFESRGGRLVHGRGKLTGPRTVTVGDLSFTARRGIVIATGSRPTIPPISGLSEVDYWTTHDVIQVETLPKSMLVLGGGAIGCELGQVMARFGVEVTIIEADERLLPAEEPQASQALEQAFAAEDIHVHTRAMARKARMQDGSIVITLDSGEELAAERLLVATGRRVDLSGLGLETVGLDDTAPFIQVDEHMRAADGIWAMGDVTGKAMFTHVALYQSAIVAADILGESHPPARYDALPRVTFTDPEVGSVGMSEAGVRAAGLEVVVAVKQLPATFRGWLHASGNGIIKLIADRKSGVLVGATTVGPHGGEMLGLLSLAVHARLTLADLRSMIYAFPTFYGAIGEAVGAYGRGLATVLDPDYQGFEAPDRSSTAE